MLLKLIKNIYKWLVANLYPYLFSTYLITTHSVYLETEKRTLFHLTRDVQIVLSSLLIPYQYGKPDSPQWFNTVARHLQAPYFWATRLSKTEKLGQNTALPSKQLAVKQWQLLKTGL